MPTVVLGVAGGIAAYKACEVLRELQRCDLDVRVVMTPNATRFVSAMTFEALSRHPVLADQFAPTGEGSIPHIELADRADLLLVVPATANIIGKLAHGIADDALSTLFLASAAPAIVAPAMNARMWAHPAVQANLVTLRARGVLVIEPGAGRLACGWEGKGRLAEVSTIVETAIGVLRRRQDLAHDTVLVTAGPTVEDIDPVRFISNRSSGRMGYRLAEAARDRGARVMLVSGPTGLADPSGVEVMRVRSAEEMAQAVDSRLEKATILVMAAAVADYRPVSTAKHKLKKSEAPTRLELAPTRDILASLGPRRSGRFVVGFAAETENLEANARHKLREKSLDLIVANQVGREGVGIEAEENAAMLIDPAHPPIDIPRTSKRELADRIWDRVAELRQFVSPPGEKRSD